MPCRGPQVIDVAPSQTPYLWQRGLSLYYADRFQDGADQFRRDVAVNPNDTEEAIWAYLCEVRSPAADLLLPNGRREGRCKVSCGKGGVAGANYWGGGGASANAAGGQGPAAGDASGVRALLRPC